MKIILSSLAIFAIIFLFGCQQENLIMPTNQMLEHIGCQEQEITVDGKCVPAIQNNAGIFEQDVDYYVDSMSVHDGAIGFIAKPKQTGIYPGVVMMHEWWGLNDNIKYMAKLLAKQGYIVFAVDLYDGQVANDSTKATELSQSVSKNPEKALATMKDAVKYLREMEGVKKIASIGWCFGGGQSLQLSMNEKLDATVIYYGFLVDDKEKLKNIKWPVIGFFGTNDTNIPPATVAKFKENLDSLNITNNIYEYPGVGHAFANPSGSTYAKEDTIDAWEKTIEFLDTNLKNG